MPAAGTGAAYYLQARTEAQAYQLRAYRGSDPSRPVLLPRRRLVQQLGLDVFELVPGQPIGFESSLRVLADLGLPRGDAAALDGVRSEEADLLYANLSYRGPRTEVRLGRQLQIDFTDFMAFDGVKLRHLLGSGVGAEAFGGLWVKGASLLGSPAYQPDGTRESDARRLVALVPGASPELDDFEPVWGARVFLDRASGFSGSIEVRRAYLAGKVNLDRAAAQLGYSLHRIRLWGALEHDLFAQRLANLRLSARFDGDAFSAAAEAARIRPVFSADSVFLYFATAPRDEARLRAEWSIGEVRLHSEVSARAYHLELNREGLLFASLGSLGPEVAAGARTGATGRRGTLRYSAEVSFEGGRGRQLWLDLTAGYSHPGGSSVDARLSAAELADRLNPLLRGRFIGAQVWATRSLAPPARASLILEANANELTRAELRAFLLFDLEARL
ncbi:MAG: hypothetical protein HYZ28_07720 [Myxococcales bacterium]|nr:hypothetical protein [Myxococcales bacterium]